MPGGTGRQRGQREGKERGQGREGEERVRRGGSSGKLKAKKEEGGGERARMLHLCATVWWQCSHTCGPRCGWCGGMAIMEKCAMTSTCKGVLTTGIPIGPNRAGAPGGSLGCGAHILKPNFLD